eukprot:TRINITY_DN664_c1_g1_i4.p1 TRINITY_DN664_c1_g1~~TRINITY_DN664_c1_g1_i4.p1  ORF type:complete len:600 (-),score=125.90 TRINITY_DN664_c1_g1_i4:73-1872(-)
MAVSDSTCRDTSSSPAACTPTPFYQSYSSTFQPCTSACTFQLNYGDGSFAQGVKGTDIITIGSASAATPFGVIQRESPDFEPDPLDGILGLAYSSLGQNGLVSPYDAYVSSNQLADQFSMCMNPTGGVMVLGGYGSFHTGSYTWVNSSPTSGFYMVTTSGVYLGSSLMGGSSGVNAIVDSGTTAFVVPTAIFTSIQNFMRSQGLRGTSGNQNLFNGYCISMSSSEAAAFPTLTIPLTGITLTVNGADYMRPFTSGGRVYYCLGMSGISQSFAILGDYVMQKYEVAFNRAGRKVGFAPVSACTPPIVSAVTPVNVNLGASITVTITGTNLGTGSDITAVTLAGVEATIIAQTANSVTVTSGVSSFNVTGSAIVTSTSMGATAGLRLFSYGPVPPTPGGGPVTPPVSPVSGNVVMWAIVGSIVVVLGIILIMSMCYRNRLRRQYLASATDAAIDPYAERSPVLSTVDPYAPQMYASSLAAQQQFAAQQMYAQQMRQQQQQQQQPYTPGTVAVGMPVLNRTPYGYVPTQPYLAQPYMAQPYVAQPAMGGSSPAQQQQPPFVQAPLPPHLFSTDAAPTPATAPTAVTQSTGAAPTGTGQPPNV